MANLPITQLPVALTLTGNEQTVVVQNGITKQVSVSQIANVVMPGKLITNIVYDPNTYMMIIYYSDGTNEMIGPVPGFKPALISGGNLFLVDTDNVAYNLGNVVGPSGFSGFSGLSGFSGFSGRSGFSGFSGISGFSGTSGFSGYSGAGTSGFSGGSGYSGFSGISGFSGDSGISGFSGGSGISGFSGYSGESGYSGSGVSGFSGYSGFSGESGFSGFSGYSSFSGFSGISGYSGFSGNSGAGGAIGHYGSFIDTTDQTIANVNNAQQVAIGTALEQSGVTLSSDDITIVNAGTYSLTYSMQLTNAANSVEKATVWLKKNGSDVADSASEYDLQPRKDSNTPNRQILTVNYVFTAAANDVYELYWASTSVNLKIETLPAGTTPVTPVSPGVILTVTQVMYTQSGYSGTSGFSGFSGEGTSGFSGFSGESGYSGFSGFSGVDGTVGVSGFSGESGYSGFSGISGFSGDSGISGFSGFSGVDGTVGVSGFSGFSGTSGFSGYSGISGFSGFSGAPPTTVDVTGTSGTTTYPTLVLGLSGSQTVYADAGFTYNASTNAITAGVTGGTF